MIERDLIDALNDCLDRTIEGESVESCLQDYPQYAERLRGLLNTGDLVHRAQAADAQVAALRERGRARVRSSLYGKRKRKARATPLHRFLPITAAASLVIIVGVLAVMVWSRQQAASSPFTLSCDFPTQGIVVAAGVTPAMPQPTFVQQGAQPTNTLSPIVSLTPRPTTTATTTAVPTLMASLPTNTIPGGGGSTFGSTPTTTPPVALSTATMVGAYPTPVGGNIVSTSVALMTPLPPTPTTGGIDIGDVAGTSTPLALIMPTGTAPILSQQQPTRLPPTAIPALMPLNAGEINDNTDWNTYLLYRQYFMRENNPALVRDVDVNNRQTIRVQNSESYPVIGARVCVFNGQTLIASNRTYANGETLFFANAHPAAGAQTFDVVVEKDDQRTVFQMNTSDPNGYWTATLDVPQTAAPIQLDVLFLLDTTGSMGDEIAQLQNNLLWISSQIDQMSIGISTRYGLVLYRDRGDEYVVRPFDFTPDVGLFQANLATAAAGGGGDGPEALNEALGAALTDVSWRGGSTIQLIFLIADAEPHLDYAGDTPYSVHMMRAAEEGIKINPIASSGLTPIGEYIFRQMGQYTMGSFIFLTYDSGTSGTPGESRPDLDVGEPADPAQGEQGDYTVQELDDVVLRLIRREIEALSTR
jgi:hypothetical protein